MPVSLQHLEDEGVLFNCSGVMTGSETIALNTELVTEITGGRAIRYQVVDLRKVEDFQLSTAEMKILARQDSNLIEQIPTLRIAIVVNDDLTFGMNRMYATYLELSSEEENCRIFTHMPEALNWAQGKEGQPD